MVFVRHRSSSGRLEDLWEFDPARGVVMLTFRLGSAPPVSIDVRVSSPERARIGSWYLKRTDESTWEIAPHVFGVERLVPHPIHANLGGAAVVLLDAPETVSLELEAA